ncbi:MAG: hypothetical protein HYY00_09455 [Chloroflexi bacterium]|nr:hypothetical protein [Chloroflexota bacterium]
MYIQAYENIQMAGAVSQNPVELEFESIRAEGRVYPVLILGFKARATVSPDPLRPYSIQPTRVICQLYLGTDPIPNAIIAEGEAQYPLGEWQAGSSRNVIVRCPLSRAALQQVAESLRGSYLPAIVRVQGTAVYRGSAPSAREIPFQFQEWEERIRPAANDWITRVLEPVGWGKYLSMCVPVPSLPSEEEYGQAVSELGVAERAFLAGDDRSVFLHAYNAWDPIFYSRKYELLARAMGDDDNKKGAVLDLVKAVHRFANGGRHLPEERVNSGGFEVDHIDAEYVRLVTNVSAVYLAKRVQSRQAK